MTKINQSGLKHAPIYYGDGYHNGQNYLKIEYIDYSVEEYLRVSGKSVSEIGNEMLHAIRELHENGFLH